MSLLEERLERMIMTELGRELDKAGITDEGIRVNMSDLRAPSMGGFGALGAVLPPYWLDVIKQRQEKKSQKARKVALALTARAGQQIKEAKARGAQGRPSKALAAKAAGTANAAIAEAREADAPTITKAEVEESVRPAVREAAKQMAEGIRAEAKVNKTRLAPRMFEASKSASPFWTWPEMDWNFPQLGRKGDPASLVPVPAGISGESAERNVSAEWTTSHERNDWDFDYGFGDEE